MGWYNHIENTLTKKQASAKDIAFNAIQLLDNGLNPRDVATIFTNQMKAEDPTFDASQISGADANNLKTYLQGISANPAAGNMPGSDPTQGLGDMPGSDPTQGLGDMPGSDPTQGLGDMPGSDSTQELGGLPEDLNEDGTPDEGALNLGDIPEFGDIEETVPEISEPQKNTVEEVDEIVDTQDDPITPVQRVIEEEGVARDIQEVENEVPELERRDQFEDMTLDIRPEDMAGVEQKKHISQREFSIPTTYKVKNDNLKKLLNKIAKINKYKDSKGLSPCVVRFKTQDGQASSEPVTYTKEKTNRATGDTFYPEYVDFVLEGELPNPLGNPVKGVKNPDGTVSYEEVVYQIIGSIEIVPFEGFNPKEEKFATEEEAARHAGTMNAQDPMRIYEVGKKNRSQKFKELHPESQGMFYPSTYSGKWRTVVDHYPNTPAWKHEYEEGSPLDCDHCGTKKRGLTARRSVYVAIEYPANQLITENGKPREPLPEDMFGDQAKGIPSPKQVWIGTDCVQGQKTALQFLKDLEEFREVAMGAEKTGRASDAFGGSMRSPKGIEPIMANYFAAGRHRPGRSGSWFPKRYGEGLSNYDFKEFKKYYFGRYRSDMRKANIEQFEHEEAINEYPEKLQEHERQMAIYPHVLEEWRQRGADPETKPNKPPAPKDPSTQKTPAGAKPLPWGEITEEDTQKANDIIGWWREKQHDPTIDYNDLEVNEALGASGEKMHNMISIALSGKVDSSFFHYIPDLVYGYERDKRATQRAEEDKVRTQEQLGRDEGQGLIDNEAFNAKRLREQEQAAEGAARTEQLGEQGITLSDITQVPEGSDFVSELKHIGTKEYGRGGGRYSDFTDSQGNKYRIFDNYGKERRDPKYDFQNGEDYILKGKRGATNPRYRNTVLENIEVVDTNAPTPPGEDIIARPGTIPEEAIVPNAVPEATPEVAPEAPVIPEVAPEAPIEREPVEDTILGDEERQKTIERINNMSNYAQNVIETGRTRDTQDDWGNTVPGKEMTPIEIIPLYLDQVSKAWPKFDKEHFANRLNETYQEHGKPGLLSQIKLIPYLARNMI